MSGRKRALLRLREKDRSLLKKIDDRLKEVDRDFGALEKKINQINETQRSKVENQMLERQAGLNDVLDQLSNQTSSLAQENNNLLSIQREIIDTEFREFQNSLDANNIDFQENIEYSITSKIEEYFFTNKENLESIQYSLDLQHVRESAKMNYAYDCYLVAGSLYESVYNLYQPPENYLAQLYDIKLELDLAFQNMQNGFYEAAIISIQRGLLELNKIQFALENEIQQEEELEKEAIIRLMDLKDYANSCKTVPAINLDGEELPVMIDVDFWSSGRLSWIILQLDELQSKVAQSLPFSRKNYLADLLEHVIPEWEQEIQDCVVLSRKDVLASQIRYDIAKLAIEALLEQGYRITYGNYQDDDLRNPYEVNLNRIDDCEVKIRVSQEPGIIENYSIDIESQDKKNLSEHEMKFRAYELLSSLDSSGLKVGSVTQDYSPTRAVSELKPKDQYRHNRNNKKLWH